MSYFPSAPLVRMILQPFRGCCNAGRDQCGHSRQDILGDRVRFNRVKEEHAVLRKDAFFGVPRGESGDYDRKIDIAQ